MCQHWIILGEASKIWLAFYFGISMSGFLALLLLGIVFYLYLRRAVIEWTLLDYVRERQNDKVDLRQVDAIRRDAVTFGLEDDFDRYFQALVAQVGEGNVKNGHILWILDKLEQDVELGEGTRFPHFE